MAGAHNRRPTTPAIEYNIGRTGGRYRTDGRIAQWSAPLSSTALRVLTVLTGWWSEADSRCDVRRGTHAEECRHRENRIYFSLKMLALEALGSRAGGRQVADVAEALDELAADTTYWERWTPGAKMRQVAHVLSLRQLAGGSRVSVEVAWDPFLLESLLAGRFQLIPRALVRGLTGRSAFRFWARVLSHRAVALLKSGESLQLTLGEPGTSVAAAEVGAPRTRTDKLSRQLAVYARRGNALQDEFALSVGRDSDGQVLVRVTRLSATVNPAARTANPRRGTGSVEAGGVSVGDRRRVDTHPLPGRIVPQIEGGQHPIDGVDGKDGEGIRGLDALSLTEHILRYDPDFLAKKATWATSPASIRRRPG